MRRLQWRYLLATLLPLLLIVIVAGSVAARPAPQDTTLTVGYIGSPGDAMAQGVQLAISEINATGGITADNGTTYTLTLQVVEVTGAAEVPGALSQLSNAIAIFGPSSNVLAVPNVDAFGTVDAPVLTAARSRTLDNAGANVFRLIPPDGDYASVLATYLVQELNIQSVVVVGAATDVDTSNTSTSTFSTTFSRLSGPPEQTIQVQDNIQLAGALADVPTTNPDAVVLFGNSEGAQTTLETLRDAGWDGLFVYRDAQRALLEDDGVDAELFAGTIGIDNWSFAPGTVVGRTFLLDYVQQFGDVPGPLSAAGYDALYALSTVIRDGAVTPAAARDGLTQVRFSSLVSGPINPAVFGNQTMSQSVYVFEVTANGGLTPLAVYDDGVQRSGIGGDDQQAGGDDDEGVVGQPTARPTNTAVPTIPPPPTITPSVLTGTVSSEVRVLNVRSGPDADIYEVVDQLNTGQQVTIVGRNADFSWFFVQYAGQTGWVFAEFLNVFDPGGQLAVSPVIAPPNTPTPAPTEAQLEPDLFITNVTISPNNPRPGNPISATVTITNQGRSDAGSFAVATSFLPGSVYTANNLSGLAAGQTVTTTLTNTVTTTGYVPDLGIVVDLNDEVAEGAAGENNNIFTVSYKVDRAVTTEAQVTLFPGNTFNFAGPSDDLTWDGNVITMSTSSGDARIGLVGGGLDYVTAAFGDVTTYATGTTFANPQPGQVFAMITDEDEYGYMRVDNRNGTNVTVTYRIYDMP